MAYLRSATQRNPFGRHHKPNPHLRAIGPVVPRVGPTEDLEKLLVFGSGLRAAREGLTRIDTTVRHTQQLLGMLARPAPAPYFRRVADHVEETAKEQEARERGDAGRFSIDFVPSVTLTGLSNKVAHLRKKAADCANPRGYGGSSPRSELGDYIDGL